MITDLPKQIPGLDAWAACITAKSVHFPRKEGRNRAGAHSDIAGPVLTKSASGKEYEYIVVDDYSRAVYMRPLRLKWDAPEAFKASVENESEERMREIMTDNAHDLSMGRMRQICEEEGIKLHTSVRYSPEWAEAYNAATYLHNRTPTRALDGRAPYGVLYGVKPDVSHLRVRSRRAQRTVEEA